MAIPRSWVHQVIINILVLTDSIIEFLSYRELLWGRSGWQGNLGSLLVQ
jgi:hypothetical protein